MIDFEKDIKIFPEDIKAQADLMRISKKRLSFDEYFLFLDSITGLFKFNSPQTIRPRKYYAARFEL